MLSPSSGAQNGPLQQLLPQPSEYHSSAGSCLGKGTTSPDTLDTTAARRGGSQVTQKPKVTMADSGVPKGLAKSPLLSKGLALRSLCTTWQKQTA